MKTAFVCDSTLQVNEEFCKNYPLSIVPLEVRNNYPRRILQKNKQWNETKH